MAATQTTSTAAAADTQSVGAGGWRFDLAAALLALWVMGGLYLDGWAHNNTPGLFESFFTPWHAVLYSGFLAVAAFHVLHAARAVARGRPLAEALPPGYLLSLLGVAVFAFGAVFDLAWHSLFGFEEDLAALLSPSHLLLATGGVLFTAGPLRAAWHRPPAARWRDFLPAGLSLFALLGILTFFTQYAHFLTMPEVLIGAPRNGSFYQDLYGIVSLLIPAALLVGTTLLLLQRAPVPPGYVTLLWGGNSLLMGWLSFGLAERFPALWVAAVAGAAGADALMWWLRPGPGRVGAVRLFAFGAPVILYLLYFAALIATAGTWWSIHMWLGSTLLGGLAGLFLSFLAFPAPGARGRP